LWEAFLVQMNDFEQILELELRRLLDPIVAGQPPARRARQKKPRQPILTVERVGIALAADAIPVIEPVVVAVPVAAAHQI
jgi:hypothetical protein